jgi:GTP-binding protein
MATPAHIVDTELPTVALVGRVNVGKSTLFNKIIEANHALVSPIAGTTRTRNIGIATWRGKNFRLIDTGGLTFSDDVPLESDIIKQTEIGLTEADVIVFVVDLQDGILPQEKELAKKLRQQYKSKPIIFIANKADNSSSRELTHNQEWLQLGMGKPLPVSAANGKGIGDLLDLIYEKLGTEKIIPKKLEETTPIKVALMGRPNVGKSSLFNKLIGEDRVIVSDMPHTTREPHDTLVEIDVNDLDEMEKPGEDKTEDKKTTTKKQQILFIDTAGIRRKTKVNGELETIGVQKSIATVNRADIVLLILDATQPIADQDQQLAGLLREHTRSVILIINKWDMAEDNEDNFRNEVKDLIYKKFPHLEFAPVLFMSAKTGYRIHQVFPQILHAWKARHIQIPQTTLNDFLKRATKHHLPVRGRGVRHPKLLGFQQIGTCPPKFEIFVKSNTSVHISYVRYLTNRMREEFDFFANPIIITLTKSKKV